MSLTQYKIIAHCLKYCNLDSGMRLEQMRLTVELHCSHYKVIYSEWDYPLHFVIRTYCWTELSVYLCWYFVMSKNLHVITRKYPSSAADQENKTQRARYKPKN